jgi:hypothetical protein
MRHFPKRTIEQFYTKRRQVGIVGDAWPTFGLERCKSIAHGACFSTTEVAEVLECVLIAMMEKSQFRMGHDPIGRRPNISAELMRLGRDPLEELLEVIDAGAPHVLSNPRSRYREAYYFYFLSLDRYLREMSVAAGYSKGPKWIRRSGGRQQFSPGQRKLAKQYKQVAPFLEFDLVNCLIHSRILLDRVAGVSQSFLTGHNLPSFTSFTKHKKFFVDLREPYGLHEEYAEYIRKQTDWFEMPLLEVRDKFVVHAAHKHMRFLGYGSDHELDLVIILPDDVKTEKPLASVKWITVNALRLSYDMEKLLKWMCQYGLAALKRKA